MSVRALIRHLLAALAVGALLFAGLPGSAVANDVHPDTADPVTAAVPDDDHGERCCLPDLGGHGQCHATAALADVGNPPWSGRAGTVPADPRPSLPTRRGPPLLEPPIPFA
ncbi:MAG: hypothetical protein R3298_11640 [Gammaproteobacteria bacterium]|nr:hypothetical protein [Gammaproteobacteria bacterium]